MKIVELRGYADCEGRTVKTLGYFTNSDDAEKVRASGLGGIGAPVTPDVAFRGVQVHTNLIEFVAANPNLSAKVLNQLLDPADAQAVYRQRALNKLTPEERRALGV